VRWVLAKGRVDVVLWIWRMADFLQHPKLPTLHHLASPQAGEMEAELKLWTRDRPVALLLPALFVECERPAFPGILEEVSQVDYVTEVVITMNQMREVECGAALAFLRRSLKGKRVRLLWNDGPELLEIWKEMEGLGCPPYMEGKGSNIWMGLAWLEASGHKGLVISHDTDILNYTRGLLWKLSMPLLHPRMGYRFAKGYYSRVADRLYGRVTRLLFFPLIQAFADVLGQQPLIEHLQSFRYPLSGEFGADMEALGEFALPSGWGLEIAMLAEAQRVLPVEKMCQVDLGFHYEHRHRKLEPGGVQREEGLISAAMEVARCLFYQVLKHADERGGEALLRVVVPRYHERAKEWLNRYEHVSIINGLTYSREEELAAVTAFSEALERLIGGETASSIRVPGMRPGVRDLLARSPGLAARLRQAAIEV
jgi:glucosyl-3-phosphoglycerate synthase